MITVYPYEKLGHADYGWLDARYHFSFANYNNPARMGFGPLRVVNDDTVRAGAGFDMHPHKDMEIITYIRQSAITHRDSLGNEGRTQAGEVQVMSAGTGIVHAEENREDEDIRLYQIWIRPRERGVAPRWETARFPRAPVDGRLPLLVSGRAEDEGKGALYIHADAAITGGRIPAGGSVAHDIRGGGAYLLVSDGSVTVDGTPLKKGDGAQITDTSRIEIAANGNQEAEVLVIDVIP